MAVRLQDHVSVTKVEGGSVILDERSGRYWQINSSAGTALDALLGGGDAEAAAEALVRRYEVDSAQARADVKALLSALRSASLVEERTEA
ncbi:lasso peptide biosynthesis PqqD family chaperone [Streptomyces huiliensis]|uniref:lasso peptide biosynthesis PqqD family chaperone n=1 Tax=Streptomyces huiliensis TaxID=2876027 RepID=UPI001CBCA76C|nr:lasso peptide biosynthesis PqqD family chaperone [Streptomyces huiliensis]MBZ4318584.1 lasso peptide biosynthesis PqqD family chaperone [Streptomyces huiliensis]